EWARTDESLARAVELRRAADGRLLVVRLGQTIEDVEQTILEYATRKPVPRRLYLTQILPCVGLIPSETFQEAWKLVRAPAGDKASLRRLSRSRTGSADWYCEVALEYLYGLRFAEAHEMAAAALRLAPKSKAAEEISHVAEDGPAWVLRSGSVPPDSSEREMLAKRSLEEWDRWRTEPDRALQSVAGSYLPEVLDRYHGSDDRGERAVASQWEATGARRWSVRRPPIAIRRTDYEWPGTISP
ncbi:MAG: hypothetical protein HY815_17760, partial [Candidatus Riflebacteria bacterium]|nr:hypothetical protein [Candidatus Riflebacteria bacterium]